MAPFARSIVIAAVSSALLLACSKKAETPPELSMRYHALLDSLDSDSPGESAELLEAFARENESYSIADSARAESARFLSASDGRYHEARELARAGEFDRAEQMLQDLALVKDSDDAASAARHLEFEFYFEKAKWLLFRQRFEESEAVARELMKRDLNRFQRDQVEQILDNVAHIDAAVDMTERSRTESACRQLIVFLANLYVNEGRYPETLSLPELERLDPHNSRTIVDALESIEDYSATQDKYSLVAVGKRGERFRIVDGRIEN